MVKGNIFGKMEEVIKDIMKMIKNKDLEYIIGRMEELIKVIGKMDNLMD